MKTLLLAGLASATAVAAAPAHAHPDWHYTGGCRSFTISDGTESPQTKWDGEIHVSAVALDAAGTPAPTAAISVDCELRVNGAVPGTIVFSCSTPGIGSVGCADQFSYHADPDDVVTMCDHVTVNGEFHKDCGGTTAVPMVPIVPEPVQDLLDETNHMVDDELCDYLASLAGTYGPLEIGPDGDLFLDGVRLHDCPPYDPDGVVTMFGDPVGTITLSSTGGQPQVVVGGVFALPSWNCGEPAVTGGRLWVSCDWLGLDMTSRPVCGWASALAVLVPPYEVDNSGARTATVCHGNLAAELVETDVSTGGMEFAYRDLELQYTWNISCSVDDGDGGVPTRFFAQCIVRFVE